MAIPDFQSVMLPLLQTISDGREYRVREAVEALSATFGLSDEERSDLMPSGTDSTFNNRVRWAAFHLQKAELLHKPRRGYLKITVRGRSVLEENPATVDLRYLKQYPEYLSFREKRKENDEVNPTIAGNNIATPTDKILDEQTPEEAIDAAYRTLRSNLAEELLEQINACTPAFFEKLVVDLLVGMGYGGTLADAGQVLGKSSDGGIDGTIKEDRLGLGMIYVQAKRWENTVGRPDIQQFAGALQGQKARRGVFITTSNFSKQARDYASAIESSVVLVDGEMLAGLMIDHGVGTTVESSYQIKRVDSDYFEET
ncbi:MAG: restriction endonuclease [Rubrobacteraceae bacterium]|nr:restriction endonuclease [Rubrobacteraceae bacterium]